MKHYTDKEINDKLDRLEQEREKMVFVSNAWIEASLKRCREIDRKIDALEAAEYGRFGYLHFVKK